MAFQGTRSGLHQLRMDDSEIEMGNGRLEIKSVPGSPKSENAIHVRKTAGIGPRSVSVMDKVNNWFRRNSAANSPVPGTSNRHDIDGGQGDIRPDTGDVAGERPKSQVGGIRLSDNESDSSVEVRPCQKRRLKTKPRSVVSNDISSDDEAVSQTKSMKQLAKAFNKCIHGALNSVTGLVKKVSHDVREMAIALQATQVSSLVLLEKMQEKMEVLAQRQGNSQVNPLHSSDAEIVSPMGQGSQGSHEVHDESLVVRGLATGTQPVNTGVISLAFQVNSVMREPESRNHNMVNISSMGHGSQVSHEILDESLPEREVAKGTQPVNTSVVNLADQANSGFREPESRYWKMGPMDHGSPVSYGNHDEYRAVRAMATGTQPVNTGMASLAAQVNSGIREAERRGCVIMNGNLPQAYTSLPVSTFPNLPQAADLDHSSSALQMSKTKNKSVSKRAKSARIRDVSSDSENSDEDTDGSDKMSDDEARVRAARSQAHSKNVKIQPFKGKGGESWPVWFNRFSEAAERRGWSKERRLDELLMRMQGEVAEFVYGQLKSNIR